jgi:G patch domain-containing protein 1
VALGAAPPRRARARLRCAAPAGPPSILPTRHASCLPLAAPRSFDPFVGAEEFRAAKAGRQQQQGQGQGRGGGAAAAAAKKRARGVAFGTGVLEESDTFGYMEDYVDEEGEGYGGVPGGARGARGGASGLALLDAGGGGGRGGGGGGARRLQALALQGYDFELGSDEEDGGGGGGRGRRRRRSGPLLLEAGRPEALALQSKEQLAGPGNSLIPGFRRSEQIVETSFYPPPEVPAGYEPRHSFAPPPGSGGGGAAGAAGAEAVPDAPEAPPPAAAALRQEVGLLRGRRGAGWALCWRRVLQGLPARALAARCGPWRCL